MVFGLLEDHLDVRWITLFKLALEEAAAMLVLAKLVKLTLHGLNFVVGISRIVWESVSSYLAKC